MANMADSVEVVLTLKQLDIDLSTPPAIQLIFQLILGAEGHHGPIRIKKADPRSACLKFGISQTAVPVLIRLLSSSKQSVFRELGVTSIQIGGHFKKILITQCKTEYIQSSCVEFHSRRSHHSFQDELLAQLILHLKLHIKGKERLQEDLKGAQNKIQELETMFANTKNNLENKIEQLRTENNELKMNAKRAGMENRGVKKVIVNTLDSDMKNLKIEDSSEEERVSREKNPIVSKSVMETEVKVNDGLRALPSTDLQVDTESFGNDELKASSSSMQPRDDCASQGDNRAQDVDTASFGNQGNKDELKASSSSMQSENVFVSQEDNRAQDVEKIKTVEELRVQLEREKIKRCTYEKTIKALGTEYFRNAEKQLEEKAVKQKTKDPGSVEWIQSSQNTETSWIYELEEEKKINQFYENYLNINCPQMLEQNKQEIGPENVKLKEKSVVITETQSAVVSSQDNLVTNKQRDDQPSEKPVTESGGSVDQDKNKLEEIQSSEEPIIATETEMPGAPSQVSLSNSKQEDEMSAVKGLITHDTLSPGVNQVDTRMKTWQPTSEDHVASPFSESAASGSSEHDKALQIQMVFNKEKEIRLLGGATDGRSPISISKSRLISQEELRRDNKIIDFVAGTLRKTEWRPFVRCLGLSDQEIEEVEESNLKDLKETKRAALVKWRGSEKTDKNTGICIVKGLHECKLNQLADLVCQKFDISDKPAHSNKMAAFGGSGDSNNQGKLPFSGDIIGELELLKNFKPDEMEIVARRLKLQSCDSSNVAEVCKLWEECHTIQNKSPAEQCKLTRFFVRVMRDLSREDIVDVMKSHWSGNGFIGPVLPDRTSIQKIPFSQRNRLSNMMSVEKSNGNDWRIIAEEVQFPDYQNLIPLWQQQGNGGDKVLQTWQGRTDATVGKLYAIFVKHSMSDCAALLE